MYGNACVSWLTGATCCVPLCLLVSWSLSKNSVTMRTKLLFKPMEGLPIKETLSPLFWLGSQLGAVWVPPSQDPSILRTRGLGEVLGQRSSKEKLGFKAKLLNAGAAVHNLVSHSPLWWLYFPVIYWGLCHSTMAAATIVQLEEFMPFNASELTVQTETWVSKIS